MKLEIDLILGKELGAPLIKCLLNESIVVYDGPAATQFSWQIDIVPGEYELIIVHYGKTANDHVISPSGEILVDKFVQIDQISVDEITLTDEELWRGKFYPLYNADYVMDQADLGNTLPYYISPNLYLGHNGAWKWEFCYPFIPWIITQRRQGPQLEGTIFQTSHDVLQQAKDFFSSAPDI
jgi:hypothetical protein